MGSSQIIREGSQARARAMPRRCLCPPLNSCGTHGSSCRGPGRPTKKLLDPVMIFGLAFYDMMNRQGLTDDISGALPGVQGAVRVLEDERHLAGAGVAFFLFGKLRDILSFENRLAGGGTIQTKMQRPTVVLPQPLSPTSPSVSADVNVEADIVYGFDVGHFCFAKVPG